jgi:hypothetical protein
VYGRGLFLNALKPVDASVQQAGAQYAYMVVQQQGEGEGFSKTETFVFRKSIASCFAFYGSKNMRDVRTIMFTAVSRRDLCYVSENKGFRFGKTLPFALLLHNHIGVLRPSLLNTGINRF